MKKINLAITGCLGRMGQQIIKSSKLDKKFKLVTLTENRKINRKISVIKPELNDENAFKKANFIFSGMSIRVGAVRVRPTGLISDPA